MHPLLHVLRTIWLDLLALVVPVECVACGAADRECCDACLRELRYETRRVLRIRAPAGVEAHVAGSYAGVMGAVLVGYKHAGAVGFARALGDRLRLPLEAALWAAAREPLRSPPPPRSPPPSPRSPPRPILIVTAPSRQAKLRERGYRHVDLMVRRALRNMPRDAAYGLPRAMLAPRVLRTRRGRGSQLGLRAGERARNAALIEVRGAARRRVRGREVLLVDDVITTGATLAAAIRALESAGARVLGVCALCATARRDGQMSTASAEVEIELEVAARIAVGFEKGVTVRPAMWPPA